ncbi:hypothetical protein FRC02_004469 [Tulasnella sp. 418]|nr:hypothetical protein FRC02_004469 [Tulasnella sp. 418]
MAVRGKCARQVKNLRSIRNPEAAENLDFALLFPTTSTTVCYQLSLLYSPSCILNNDLNPSTNLFCRSSHLSQIYSFAPHPLLQHPSRTPPLILSPRPLDLCGLPILQLPHRPHQHVVEESAGIGPRRSHL